MRAVENGVVAAETEIFVTGVALYMGSALARLVRAGESFVVAAVADVFFTFTALFMLSALTLSVSALEHIVPAYYESFTAGRTSLYNDRTAFGVISLTEISLAEFTHGMLTFFASLVTAIESGVITAEA